MASNDKAQQQPVTGTTSSGVSVTNPVTTAAPPPPATAVVPQQQQQQQKLMPKTSSDSRGNYDFMRQTAGGRREGGGGGEKDVSSGHHHQQHRHHRDEGPDDPQNNDDDEGYEIGDQRERLKDYQKMIDFLCEAGRKPITALMNADDETFSILYREYVKNHSDQSTKNHSMIIDALLYMLTCLQEELKEGKLVRPTNESVMMGTGVPMAMPPHLQQQQQPMMMIQQQPPLPHMDHDPRDARRQQRRH